MRTTAPVLAVLLVVLSGCSVQRAPLRTVSALIPATGASVVSLTANVGIVKFIPSTDGAVHVSVELVPSHYKFFGLIADTGSEDAAKAATVTHSLTGSTLALAIQYPSAANGSGISEHWTVALPPKLAVQAHVATGELDVTGVSGGVDATLDVGKVGLEVPGGPVKVVMNVGKVDAMIHSLDYGEVTLNTNVGKSTLSVDGAAVGNAEQEGTKSSLSWKGSGANLINMQVNVGKLDVALSKS